MEIQIELLVPGAWKSRTTISKAIAERTRGRYVDEAGFFETPDGHHVNLDVADYNSRLQAAFADASAGQFSLEMLDLIDAHSYALTVSGPGGNEENLKRLMDAAKALLDAGGMAVLVLTSGMAHTADAWRELCERDDQDRFIDAFVQTLEKAPGTYVSLGMHGLGLPDAYLEGEDDPRRAGVLIGRFLLYQLENHLDLHEGAFIQFAGQAEPFVVSQRRKSEFPAGDRYHNPEGYWQLEPAEIG
jgi:hypothetical protein